MMTERADTNSSLERLRDLPAVHQLSEQFVGEFSRAEAVSAAKAVLAMRRSELLAGIDGEPDLEARLLAHLRPSLRRVLNATGVLLHTNLGRAPLPAAAVEAVAQAARGYSNLEFDLVSGDRGSRHAHVCSLLTELTGAEDAIVVNNGAAAVLLAVAGLACESGVIVSRGQLVEIGGGFRIPEVLSQAGVPLVEVGTTNRTRLADYLDAIERTQSGVVLRVHQSNFRTVGFVEEVPIEQLCSLGAAVIDDVGSGVLGEDVRALTGEPSIRRSVAAGAAVVCFSGDKLLGGPQAGLIVGKARHIAACRKHPLARAVRVGRLPLAALTATLAIYRDPERALSNVPVLSMLTISREALEARAKRLADGVGGTLVESRAVVGGGALPLLELHGPAVRLDQPRGAPDALSKLLRSGDPPLVGRIADGDLLLDPRTLTDTEVNEAIDVVETIRSR